MAVGKGRAALRLTKGKMMKKKKPRIAQEQALAVTGPKAEPRVKALSKERGGSGDSIAEWQSKDESRRLKQLEEENQRLRLLVADLTLSNQTLKLAVSKKW